MVLLHKRLHGKLGIHWLKQRLRADDTDRALSVISTGHWQRLIYQNGTNLNSIVKTTRMDSYTVLLLACCTDEPKVVRSLLSDSHSGIDLHLTSPKRGWTPLFACAHSNHVECASLLIKHGVNVNQSVRSVGTPLLIATIRNHADMVRLLRDNGAEDLPAFMGLSASTLAFELKVSGVPVYLVLQINAIFHSNDLLCALGTQPPALYHIADSPCLRERICGEGTANARRQMCSELAWHLCPPMGQLGGTGEDGQHLRCSSVSSRAHHKLWSARE
jgi:hypothetical protein